MFFAIFPGAKIISVSKTNLSLGKIILFLRKFLKNITYQYAKKSFFLADYQNLH